jgi:hypothetical protein
MKPAALATLVLGTAMIGTPVPSHAQSTDPNPAVNEPDKVSWELFVQVSKPAAPSSKNAVFETWASNQNTFTQNPLWPGTTTPPTCGAPVAVAAQPAPAAPPGGAVVADASAKVLTIPALIEFAPRVPGLQPHVVPGGGEEVRRNKATFEFIFCNKLYNRTGLRNAFAAGMPISFPTDAIEVKGDWVPVGSVTDPSLYHVNTAGGQQYALVAMHVISKQISNWTWATFEHKNNAGRCDYMGCRDNFGATIPVVPPRAPVGGQYGPCDKTPALKKMFSDAGMPAYWENYCLKGSQVDFTSSTGAPTLLGNSVIEDGFVMTSSCMTCHTRASVSSNGADAQGAGFLPSGQSPNGTPNPSWFANTLQVDFVWSIALRAIP